MRNSGKLLTIAIAAIVLGLVTLRLGPSADPRWQRADAASESLAGRLTRTEGTPLLFVPSSVSPDPARAAMLVLTLPGLGEPGIDVGRQFESAAEEHRWVLLVPSPSYDPVSGETLESADQRVDEELVTLIDEFMGRSPFALEPKIGLVGFSRGAQTAHRFALRHPERVAALASFSAGTYTMPTSSEPYPYGVGNFATWNQQRPLNLDHLREVDVLVGVGALDRNPADVVRGWDSVGGTNRLDRGARFAAALEQLGVPTRFQIYPGIGHSFTSAMRDDAVALIAGKLSASSPR